MFMNENEKIVHQNLSDSAQAVLGGKIITLNVYIDATQPTMR
jgi:hypothetical protein